MPIALRVALHLDEKEALGQPHEGQGRVAKQQAPTILGHLSMILV
jgi:hypothetical protein